MAITSIEQIYEFTESRHDYRTRTEVIYGGKVVFMDIEKSRDSFDKDKKLRCFNYNTYRYITKNY